MAYEPTEWKKGDKITAEKMNKLENGVANINPRVLVLEYEALPESQDQYTLGRVINITAQEIIDAYENGYFIILPLIYNSVLYYYMPETLDVNSEIMLLTFLPLYGYAPFLAINIGYNPGSGDENIYVTFPD